MGAEFWCMLQTYVIFSALAMKKKSASKDGGVTGVKRLKYRGEEDDDNNFAEVPYRARPMQAAYPSENSEAEDSCELRRVSPKWLIEAMKNLNLLQRNAVAELGFGHLFHLQVDSVPGKLVVWFLENFQPISCSLMLPNNQTIHIAAEDVCLIFGIPKGSIRIDHKGRTKDTELADEWAAIFHKPKVKILPSDIVTSMMADVEGGVWFHRGVFFPFPAT